MKFAAAAVLSLAALAAFPQPASAQEPAAATQAASAAAESWLALADAGDYAASWTQGAQAFRSAVTQPQWNDAMRSVRTPLGAVKSRKLVSAQATRQLPGMADGDYVVIQYQTTFATREAKEIITPMREPDGSWRVTGYFIQ